MMIRFRPVRQAPARSGARKPGARHMTRLTAVGAVICAMLAASISFGASPARAATCEENGVFWSMKDSSGARATAWGAVQEITLNSQTLKCVVAGGDAGTGHTSRILLGGVAGNWVEAGAMQKICSSGSYCQRAFFEWNIAGVPGHQTQFAFGCLNPGTRHPWEVIRESAGG